MQDNSITILHSGDWHIQDRDTNLYQEYKLILSNKIQILKETQASIYLIAGDFWHFTEQTDSEQELIFTHIAEALNIETVREVVFIAGNHDIKTDYKEFNSNKTFNSLDTLQKFVKTLAPNLHNKLTYLKQQQQYISKADSRLGWISYSLEGGMSNGNNINFDEVDVTKFNISIFHDIVRNFIDDSGLPVSVDKMKHLPYVKDFKTHNILASDIHKNYTSTSSFLQLQEDGAIKQRFVYSGSSNQTNYGEGAYIKVRKGKTTLVVGDKKVIKLHTANLDDTTSLLSTKDIELKDFISYITIDLNTRYVVPNYLDQILDNLEDHNLFGTERTFIKLKLSSEYVKFEANIYDSICKFCVNQKNVSVSIVHDKLILDVDQSLIEVDDSAMEFETDTVLEKLSDEKIIDLFNSVIESVLGEPIEEVDNESVIESVRTLFTEQLHLVNSSNTQTYNTILQSVSIPNGFMRLGANVIDLSIEGLTRIDGTNGVGKTTLFNILRYARNGSLYEGMNPKATKNKALIFNKKYVNELDDNLSVVLKAKTNGTPIIITRKSVRKWKTNTTIEQKKSKDCINYVSGITNTVNLLIMKEGADVLSFDGDEAERYLDIFLADVVENLMIINQTKLISMLNKSNTDIREMILKYIGVNFLKNLDDNLEGLKLTYNLQRPKTKIEDIRHALQIKNKFVQDSVTELETYESKITTINEDIGLLKNSEETLNKKLISLGDVDKRISSSEEDVIKLSKIIEEFEFKKMPEPLTTKEPTLNEEKVKEIKDKNITLANKIVERSNNSKSLRDENETLLGTNIQIELDNAKVNTERDAKITEIQSVIDVSFAQISDTNKSVVSVLENSKGVMVNTNITLDANNKNAQKAITNLQNEIDSGVCDSCSRAFDEEAHALHKVKNEESITEQKISIDNNKNTIDSNTQIVSKLDVAISRYKTISDLALSKDIEKLNLLEFATNELETKELVELIVSKFGEMESIKVEYLGKLMPLVDAITNTTILDNNKSIRVNDELNESDTKTVQENVAETQTIINNYNEDYRSYNSAVSSYNTEVSEANEHNKTLGTAQANLEIINNNLEIYKKDKPIYDKTIEDKNLVLVTLKTKGEERDTAIEQKHEYNLLLAEVNSEIKNLDIDYKNYIEYLYNSKVFGTYQKIIQGNLPDLVFNHYRNFINSKLNILLEDMSIKLYVDENCNLFMVDLSQGEITYTPVQIISGMQIVMLGLSLIYTISLLNYTNTISHIFIDELSGALNKGGKSGTEDINTNYQEQFVLLLSKFKEKSIFIVDHAIDNLFNNYTYTVIGNKEDKKSYFIGKI